MATPPPEAFEIVPVTKRYWWPHPKVRGRDIPWWRPSRWYLDWVQGYRYFVYGKEVPFSEVRAERLVPSVEFLDKPTNRQSKRDDSFTFVKPEKEKKP